MKEVKLNLKHSSRINYIHINSGEPGLIVSTNDKLIIGIGRLYKIPVDTIESMDDYNLFKPIGKSNELFDVRNVQDGFAFIIPIVNNITLKHDQVLGNFI